MNLKPHFERMAEYNQWMNGKVYDAAGGLGAHALAEDRGAFFGSILGTLNHIVVADTIWLKRFAPHPASSDALHAVRELPDPVRLDQILFDDLDQLRTHREWLDTEILGWASGLREDALDDPLHYHNSRGVPGHRPFSALVYHFFNHQTHHRGQVSTLLSQAGKDIGVTDLLALIPNQSDD